MGGPPSSRILQRPWRADTNEIIRSQIRKVISQNREEDEDAPSDHSWGSDFVTQCDDELNRKNRIEESGECDSQDWQNLVHAIGLLQGFAQFWIQGGDDATKHDGPNCNQR